MSGRSASCFLLVILLAADASARDATARGWTFGLKRHVYAYRPGMSVWSARKFGWLELGYTDGYFLEALRRTGWRGEIRRSHDLEYGTVVIARKLRR